MRFIFGFLTGGCIVALCWVIFERDKKSHSEYIWGRFVYGEMEACSRIMSGKTVDPNLVLENREIFDRLIEQGQIRSISISGEVTPDLCEWLIVRDIQLIYPLDIKMGGQRIPDQYYVRACDFDILEKKLHKE